MIFPHPMIMEPTFEFTGYVLMCVCVCVCVPPLNVSSLNINICYRKVFLSEGVQISAEFIRYELKFTLII